MTDKQHILVVDDHDEIRDLLGRYLGQHGYEVSLADGGMRMRQVLSEKHVDLVILHIMMPDEDGLTLCRYLKEQLERSDGLLVPLSTSEFRLLTVFLDHTKKVLSRDQLLDMTKGREALPFDRSIDNQISRLRKKIETDPKHPRLIKTVWGGGYSFTAAVTS